MDAKDTLMVGMWTALIAQRLIVAMTKACRGWFFVDRVILCREIAQILVANAVRLYFLSLSPLSLSYIQ